MDDLRRLFGSMKFGNVTSFIASGNILFDSTIRNATKLEPPIEKALQKALGYPVATFVRSAPDLTALARHPLVSGEEVPAGCSLYVAFLRAEPTKDSIRQLMSYRTPVDDFHLYQRQVLWTIRGGMMDSTFSGGLEKMLAMPATIRNATTVRKLAKIVSSETST